MAKGDNKQGPSGNTRKGSKKGEDHCNQVDAGVNTTQGNTSGQASSSDQGIMGVSPGDTMRPTI